MPLTKIDFRFPSHAFTRCAVSAPEDANTETLPPPLVSFRLVFPSPSFVFLFSFVFHGNSSTTGGNCEDRNSSEHRVVLFFSFKALFHLIDKLSKNLIRLVLFAFCINTNIHGVPDFSRQTATVYSRGRKKERILHEVCELTLHCRDIIRK